MAMKHRHAANEWIRETHDDICGATSGNVDGIQPRWIRDADTVFLVGKEMRLMDVHSVKLFCGIDNSAVAVGVSLGSYHRLRIESEFLSIDVEAVFVLGECDYKVRRGFLKPIQMDNLIVRPMPIERHSPLGPCGLFRRKYVGQYHRHIGVSERACIDTPCAQSGLFSRSGTADDSFHSPGGRHQYVVGT